MVDCPKCFTEVSPVSVEDGGRVGWWCPNCEALHPDGDYVTMRRRPLGMPR
jgi:hypothetical protein